MIERLRQDLSFAHSIIDRVDACTLPHFQNADFFVDTKPDLTPVTNADREAEDIIRAMLARSRSRDGIYGEENGFTPGLVTQGQPARRWIVDPIDGTKNFVRGVPVWATLIGLEEDGEMVMGVVSAPSLGRRWWAAKGMGAFTGSRLSNARPLRVSQVDSLEDCSFSYSSLTGWADRGRLRAFLRLAEKAWRTRAYGDFWSYMLVAEGAIDAAAEPELELYDMAALVPIVTEAGGRFTSLDGQEGPWGRDALATNGLLHDLTLDLLHSVHD